MNMKKIFSAESPSQATGLVESPRLPQVSLNPRQHAPKPRNIPLDPAGKQPLSEIPKTNKKELKRITADFDPAAYETLSQVASLFGTTLAEAVRRALGLTHFVLTERKRGMRIVLESEDGKNRKEIVTF